MIALRSSKLERLLLLKKKFSSLDKHHFGCQLVFKSGFLFVYR